MTLVKKREPAYLCTSPAGFTLDGGFAARPCVVRNMSTGGAGIMVDGGNAPSGRLRLAFSRDARTGRTCEVVWRQEIRSASGRQVAGNIHTRKEGAPCCD